MYLVTEICDREFIQAVPAATREEASKTANGLLKDHCGTIGEPERYDAYASADPPTPWPPEMALDSEENGEAGAWCNLQDMHFDAHVAYVSDLAACDMLDVLLKQLCKFTMGQNGSGCGDGACDDCPVTRALEMLGTMREAAEERQAELLEAARAKESGKEAGADDRIEDAGTPSDA